MSQGERLRRVGDVVDRALEAVLGGCPAGIDVAADDTEVFQVGRRRAHRVQPSVDPIVNRRCRRSLPGPATARTRSRTFSSSSHGTLTASTAGRVHSDDRNKSSGGRRLPRGVAVARDVERDPPPTKIHSPPNRRRETRQEMHQRRPREEEEPTPHTTSRRPGRRGLPKSRIATIANRRRKTAKRIRTTRRAATISQIPAGVRPKRRIEPRNERADSVSCPATPSRRSRGR